MQILTRDSLLYHFSGGLLLNRFPPSRRNSRDDTISFSLERPELSARWLASE